MDILQLQYFVVVAKCQSMTKAAETIHVAQPAISQAVKKINDELGVKLFIRVGRNIRLSETGKLFYSYVEPLVRELNDIPYMLEKEVGKENQTVRINVLAGQGEIVDLISEFKRENPDTIFRLSQDESEENWDIRVTSICDLDDKERINKVATERVYLAVPKNFAYDDKKKLRLFNLSGCGFITLGEDKQFTEVMESHCLASGFELEQVYEARNPSMMEKLVGAGVGVAFWLPNMWGIPDLNSVRLIEIGDKNCSWDLYIERGNKVNTSKVKREFYDFVLDSFKSKVNDN